MKLRIHRNSLRLRFQREEVARLAGGEAVEASVQFGPGPDQRLVYRVSPTGDGPARATLSGQTITVIVGLDLVRQWDTSADLALTAEQTWDGGAFTILLEKDLQRLNPKPGEDEPGVYPNPLFGKVRCDHP